MTCIGTPPSGSVSAMTTPTTTIAKSDLDTLTGHGDTLDLSDGRTLRLSIDVDDTDPFYDNPDCYGRIGESRSHPYTGRTMRPEGFDGSAERIRVISGMIWWQPPKDVAALRQSNPGAFASFRSFISQLASFGTKYVRLEVLSGTDAYHRPIVVAFEGLGGVDSLEDDYINDVVYDLATELGFEVPVPQAVQA